MLEFRRFRDLRWAALAGLLFGLAALTRNPGPALAIPVARRPLGDASAPQPAALAAPALGALCAGPRRSPLDGSQRGRVRRLRPAHQRHRLRHRRDLQPGLLEDTAHPAAWRTPRVAPEYAPLFASRGIDEGTLDATCATRPPLRRRSPGFTSPKRPAGTCCACSRSSAARWSDPITGRVEIRGIGSADPASERIGLALVGPCSPSSAVVAMIALPTAPSSARRVRPGPLFFWLVPILLLLVAAPINGLPRQRIPVDPFLLIRSRRSALAWAWDRCRRRAASRLAAAHEAIATAFRSPRPARWPAAAAGAEETTPSTAAQRPGSRAMRPRRSRAICDGMVADSRRIGRRILSRYPNVEGASTLDLHDRRLSPRHCRWSKRRAAQLRALRGAGDSVAFGSYVALFDPICRRCRRPGARPGRQAMRPVRTRSSCR